jgi:hypothetical protein
VTGLGRWFVVIGIAMAVFGGILMLAGRVPFLGRLPGDIVVERPGFTLYIPVATCLLISLLVSLILWLLRR